LESDDEASFEIGDERSVFITPLSLSEETSLVSPTVIGGNEFNSSSSSSSSLGISVILFFSMSAVLCRGAFLLCGEFRNLWKTSSIFDLEF